MAEAEGQRKGETIETAETVETTETTEESGPGVEASGQSGEASGPLAGRTVLITRARAQSAEFAALLEAEGARVVACPTIEIVPPDSYQLLDEALANLYGYDWLIFTSTNAVEHFLARLSAAGLEAGDLDELRVCAVGHATAERLAEAHVHVDIVPARAQAEGVMTALAEYLGGREAFANLNFLMPRAAAGRDLIPNELEAAGARCDVVPAYRTVRPETTNRARVEALLLGGGVDCVTFTSPSTVRHFAELFDTRDLAPLLSGVRVACIGEVTARAASDYNLSADILPAEQNAPALARAIVAHFAARR
jgi:uroporphyrinogen III methyltransferase/synthase